LLDNVEKGGKTDWLEIVKKSSPVEWYNINFKGTYLFDDKKKLSTIKELIKTISRLRRSIPCFGTYKSRTTEDNICFQWKIPCIQRAKASN
jgi:hypothetical protein